MIKIMCIKLSSGKVFENSNCEELNDSGDIESIDHALEEVKFMNEDIKQLSKQECYSYMSDYEYIVIAN